jgi:hypothetical protein
LFSFHHFLFYHFIYFFCVLWFCLLSCFSSFFSFQCSIGTVFQSSDSISSNFERQLKIFLWKNNSM